MGPKQYFGIALRPTLTSSSLPNSVVVVAHCYLWHVVVACDKIVFYFVFFFGVTV